MFSSAAGWIRRRRGTISLRISPRVVSGFVESVRNWVRQASIDSGNAPGVTTEEKTRIRQLERENAELRRANEILTSAAAFFGAELDRRPTK